MDTYVYIMVDHTQIHNVGVRHFQVLLLFLCLTASHAGKMAILAMIYVSGYVQHDELHVGSGIQLSRDTYFLAYIVMSIISGYLSIEFSNKWILFFDLLYTGLITVFTPLLTLYGGYRWFSVLTFSLGISQAMTMPLVVGLIARWCPPFEKGTFIAFIFSGRNLGIVIIKICSTMIFSKILPWSTLFYSAGMLNLLVAILWGVYGAHDPSTCRYISQTERLYVQANCDVDPGYKKNLKWPLLLKNVPFISLLIVHLGYSFGLWTRLLYIPIYLRYFNGFAAKEAGMISTVPYLTSLLFSIPIGFIGDLFVRKQILGLGFTRKLFNSVGMFGSALCVIAYTLVMDRSVTILLNALSISIIVFVDFGLYVNHTEIAPNFAGLIMGISEAVANFSPLFLPWIVDEFIHDDMKSPVKWHTLFYSTAAANILTNIVFIIWGSTEMQEFNAGEKYKSVEVRPQPELSIAFMRIKN